MKLVINARFLTQNITGVQRFAIEISKQLKKLYGDNMQFVSPKNIIHHDLAKDLNVKIIGNNIGHLWEQIDLPLYLSKNASPLLLNLGNTAPLLYLNKIIVLHSLSFLYKKWNSLAFHFLYKMMVPLNLISSKFVFTVSQYTKKEITEHYSYISLIDKMDVIYNGSFGSEKLHIQSIENKQNYLLYVGSISSSKNVNGLVDAMSLVQVENKNIVLKIVGSLNNKVFKDKKIASNPSIEFCGHINNPEELKELYLNAKAFIFPSLYESFGIPPLEAQECGCPIIISNSTALPEIYNDSALYFDPYDVNDISNKIITLFDNKALQQELIDKGFENIKRFSWETSAKKITEVVERLK
jgi:glycosyltransferase involved in cell wall biosynthesis